MNMFKFELKRLLKTTFIWSIVCSLLVILFMAIFPSMADSGMQDIVGAKLDAIPEAMLQTFNIEAAMDFSNVKDYMAYVLQYMEMAAGIFGAILGVSALSSEESNGTIEFLYSKPISRVKVVTNKLLATAISLYIFIMIIAIVTTGMAMIVKPEDIEFISLLMDIKTIYIGTSLIGYMYMAIGFLISVIIKPNKNTTAVALGVFFITYIIGIFAKLKDTFEMFLYLSPYDYFLPSELLNNGFDLVYTSIGIALIIVPIVITYIIYRKKDLSC